LNSLSPAKTEVLVIEDGVVGADEDVTKDEEWSDLWGKINALEAREADGLSTSGDLEDVVSWGEREGVSTDDDVDGGEVGDGIAVEDSLATSGGSTELGVEGVDAFGGTSDEGGSSVADGVASTAWAEVERGTADLEVVELELPPELSAQGLVDEVTSVESIVNTTEDELATAGSSWVLVEPEGEQGGRDESLSEEIVPQGGDVIGRDGVEGKSEDAIGLGLNKSQTGFRGSLSESLVLNVQSSDSNDILSDVTSNSSRSVLDGEGGSVSNISGRSRVSEAVVETASDVQEGALGGWNPEVAASSIEDHVEVLRRSSDGDWSVVLGLVFFEVIIKISFKKKNPSMDGERSSIRGFVEFKQYLHLRNR